MRAWKSFSVCLATLTLLAGGFWLSAAETDMATTRNQAEAAFKAGNYKVAYDKARGLALSPQADKLRVSSDMNLAHNALRHLGRSDEIDEFREAVIAVHKGNWRLLDAAALSYSRGEHFGFLVAGEYHRGNRRGGGNYVSSLQRDRVRALQLLSQALPLAKDDPKRNEVAQLYLHFAEVLRMEAQGHEAWRLQVLTDLTQLPDYEPGHRGFRGFGGTRTGAPVDAEGNPVYYAVPKTYETAVNDGERWRWMLATAAETDSQLLDDTRWRFASFLQEQFGVQTLAQFGGWRQAGTDDDRDSTGTYALQTLGEDETIARLATGIKRFKLPDEFNFLKIYQEIAARGKSARGEQSLDTLCQIFENRRQYPRAAECWKQAIATYGPGINDHRKLRLQQIVGNWGRFEPIPGQPAGKGATVEFRYRNGKQVSFEAHELKVSKLLDDVKAYLKSSPNQVDWQKINIGDIGYRVVMQNQKQYVGTRVANWTLDLKPRPEHVDDRITITTPLQKPGAYLLTATMADGNVSRIILWVNDTVIVKKQLDNQSYYYVADAATGAPVAKANVEFFGWKQMQVQPNRNVYKTLTVNFAEFTDKDGQITLGEKRMPKDHQWVVIARGDSGRLAYLGFSGVWYGKYYDPQYNQTKVFTITDRPVYRPGNTVKFKFWIAQAQYDLGNKVPFANRPFTIQISNPRGEKVLEKQVKTDEFGGIADEFPLPAEATLGVYSLSIVNHGGGTFRVEEYKKPEYEVTIDSPTEPVMLGEKITATIRAKYYFGAPVTKAKVKYKVLRTPHSEQWYPMARWDWLYGRGYWWFAPDYDWYPGWNNWGCRRPIGWWWGVRQTPPEVVAETEVEIGPDGTVKVEIDTLIAKELHGDQDHQYSITAEVVDESRRTIVGTGNVLVARQPFQVSVWLDRGYYRVGDDVVAHLSAQTLASKPVKGTGKLTLYKISYDDKQQPVETEVESWNVDTDPQGVARQQLKAGAPGQFRLSYRLTDAKEHTIEGGYLFTVIGQGFDGENYRFNDLELILDKQDYAPGDKVRLMINTDRADSTVLLFARPTNGIYLAPKVIRGKGKSLLEEIEVVTKDMPNFFVEALTISDGKVHSEIREVVVPPEQRVLNVEVQPSETEYKPGAETKVQVKLTDLDGKPFVGSTVLSVYDKSVEYISGGSNVAEIKEFFWKWRRSHHPRTESSLDRGSHNIVKNGEQAMSNLGIFGELVVEEDAVVSLRRSGSDTWHFNRGRMRKGDAMGGMGGMPMAAPAAARFGMEMSKSQIADTSGAPGEDKAASTPPMAETTVRKNFADTAYWTAALTTNSDGLAEAVFNLPESLTTWKMRVWAMGPGTRVGQGEAEVVTKKNLLVRLQAPRFFVQTDEVVLSANVHNYLKTSKAVEVVLEFDGNTLEPLGERTRKVTIEAGGEQRVDWRVKVTEEGEAVVRMKALSDEESDAMEMRFPVYVHGMLKMESFAGAIRPDKQSASISIHVPQERRINDSRLEIRYSPTLAGAMVDALPYLVSYPYGCTEQTLNRFLPTVITQKILQGMKLDLKAIKDKRTNLNAQEIGDDQERARQWKRYDHNPVFDVDEVRKMVSQGVEALTSMQLGDGGWGWFSGYGEHSYPHTTAVVVHGLQVAKQNNVALVPGVLERGLAWLKTYQSQQVQLLKNKKLRDAAQDDPAKAEAVKNLRWKSYADNTDAFVYMVLVDGDIADSDMLEFLYRDRTHLSAYAQAMFGLALHKQQQADKLKMILENIDQFLVQDDENQTAYLKLPASGWWYWYGSEVEANAYYLKLLSRTSPKDERASRLVKYLLNNRKHATYWNSTRDSALCIEALAEYLTASGEDRPDLTVEILVDGKVRKEVKIDAENLFTFDNKFVLAGDGVETGDHKIEIRKQGTGPLYFNAYLTTFTLEDMITRAGLEIKVNRKYYKLTRAEKTEKVAGSRGQAVDQKVEKYDRTELKNLAELTSGDLVEIELEIDSKNDYEYLVFEDMKAAGFEPVDVRSGYVGGSLGAYRELRDEKVCFFVRQLLRGKHSVSYRLRAEIPGKFSALPTVGYAMYAPELKANSDEIKLIIGD